MEELVGRYLLEEGGEGMPAAATSWIETRRSIGRPEGR